LKNILTATFISFLMLSYGQGSEMLNSNHKQEKEEKTLRMLLQEAGDYIKNTKIGSTNDPLYLHREKLLILHSRLRDAAQRILNHLDPKGNIKCYAEKDDDIARIIAFEDKKREIIESFPKTHTPVGKLASKVIGVKAVQAIGRWIGYCYQDGVATSSKKK
tara:strand:- start:1065 stop:1547 length:483 start_codon:yes stop_codon:yes gene_type:complete